jgi:hypothetical protein
VGNRGRYFGMDATRNWAEGEETDEKRREDMGGEATVGAGRDYRAAPGRWGLFTRGTGRSVAGRRASG